MEPCKLTPEHLSAFVAHLRRQEKSAATVEKYRRDAAVFFAFAGDAPVDRTLTAAYKAHLLAQGYADRSVNSMLASLNSLLTFLGWEDCKVKSVRLQRAAYCPADRELTRPEYLRLLSAAEGKPRLRLVMETICATGIRVSELRHFTVEAIRRGEVTIRCKGKSRRVLLPGKLRRRLLDYAARSRLQSGPLFLTRGGKPLDRTAIWVPDEGSVPPGGGGGGKGLPPQPPPPVCPQLLRPGKRHRQAGRRPGPLQHRHHPHLPHDLRHGAPPPAGPPALSPVGADIIRPHTPRHKKTPHNSHYVVKQDAAKSPLPICIHLDYSDSLGKSQRKNPMNPNNFITLNRSVSPGRTITPSFVDFWKNRKRVWFRAPKMRESELWLPPGGKLPSGARLMRGGLAEDRPLIRPFRPPSPRGEGIFSPSARQKPNIMGIM